MTNLEWLILDEVYLMAEYKTVFDAVPENAQAFDEALVGLLRKGWIRQLMYNETFKDYTDVDPFDATRLAEAHYVITKQGLFEHTGAA